MPGKNIPTLEKFINSPEYNGFYTFGKYLADLKLPMNQQEEFIKFVLRANIALENDFS